jgi:ubiquinone/menaquinone biosynthesis C-methylase UbiE
MEPWDININNTIDPYLVSSYEEFKAYDRFHFIRVAMQKRGINKGEFLDIGCAKGEVIYYLKDYFPKLSFTGIDISTELISKAKQEPRLQDVIFYVADAQDFNLNKIFDYVLMSGLISMFDDLTAILGQIFKHLKPGGLGYIFGCFNENAIDVLVRFKVHGTSVWQSGFNQFSLKTVKEALAPFCNEINCHKFSLSKNLPYKKDSLNSYTLTTKEKGKIITNGTNIITDFYLIEFIKN